MKSISTHAYKMAMPRPKATGYPADDDAEAREYGVGIEDLDTDLRQNVADGVGKEFPDLQYAGHGNHGVAYATPSRPDRVVKLTRYETEAKNAQERIGRYSPCIVNVYSVKQIQKRKTPYWQIETERVTPLKDVATKMFGDVDKIRAKEKFERYRDLFDDFYKLANKMGFKGFPVEKFYERHPTLDQQHIDDAFRKYQWLISCLRAYHVGTEDVRFENIGIRNDGLWVLLDLGTRFTAKNAGCETCSRKTAMPLPKAKGYPAHNRPFAVNRLTEMSDRDAKGFSREHGPLEYLGAGDDAIAYTNNKDPNVVVRLTSNAKDASVAKSLVGKEIPCIAKVHFCDVASQSEDLPLWKMGVEKLTPLSLTETYWIAHMRSWSSWDNLLPDPPEEIATRAWGKVPEGFPELHAKYTALQQCLQQHGLRCIDTHGGNLGYKPNGSLALFDFGRCKPMAAGEIE
jgi:hypothetical protein